MKGRLVRATRDAAIATAVAFGLFVLMVGVRTDVAPSGALFLRTRWADVAILCGLVFAGRLVMSLWQGREVSLPSAALARRTAQAGRAVAPFLLAAALLLPFGPGIGRYELDLGILVLTYIMLGWGLNIVVGLAGLLDLGYVAFYAVGAYSYALLAQ